MTLRGETLALLASIFILLLSNCGTAWVAQHSAADRDRMYEEARQCYTAFNAVYATCRNAGACRDLDR